MKDTRKKLWLHLTVRGVNMAVSSFTGDMQKKLVVPFGTCTMENIILIFLKLGFFHKALSLLAS